VNSIVYRFTAPVQRTVMKIKRPVLLLKY